MLKYAALLCLVAGPAFAQAGATQSPPAPNASVAQPQPATSTPPGAQNMNPAQSPNVSPGVTVVPTQPNAASASPK